MSFRASCNLRPERSCILPNGNDLLKATISEEKRADETLKDIAKAEINLRAAA